VKNYPHILSKVYGEPWLITPEKHAAIRAALSSHIEGKQADAVFFDEREEAREKKPQDYCYGQTMIIPVHGIIGNRLSSMEVACGGCDLKALHELLDVAASMPMVQRVILDVDSPGGTVTGVPEAADAIADLTETKEVFAFTETLMCSAAYWLASQATEIFCTGSARVGSIGVYSIFEDWSEALKEEGVKVNAIYAGEMKLAGAYFKPMTDKERAMFQERTDKIYSQFKEAVTANRPISDDYMQGQVFDGEDAVKFGLASGTVDSIEDLIR
jgi:signal peptide peptidase SppA